MPWSTAAACMAYCTTMTTNCTGANAQYSSLENCMDVCASLDEGALGQTTGNTLGCRLYHVGAAATGSTPGCSVLIGVSSH